MRAARNSTELQQHECEEPMPMYDAQGVYLCFVCPECKAVKLQSYRDCVGEPIEPEDDIAIPWRN